ncbi:MAG TPA: DUF885 domain-containing protein, partial [Flavisolibacter sp.]|nr:DUF885 domain-containing protein [Flavisolibacter sp.]
MKSKKLLLFLFTIGVFNGVGAQENKQLKLILAEIRQFNEKEFPTDTTLSPFPLGRYREEDIVRRGSFSKMQYDKLDAIPAAQLSPADKINVALLKYSLWDDIISVKYKAYLNPILSDEGFHTSLFYRAPRVLQNAREGRQYLNFLKTVPAYIDEHIVLMQKGLGTGISQPLAALEGFAATYRTHIVDSAEKSAFWRPFLKKPFGVTGNDWQQLTKEAQKIILQAIVPAYKKLDTFFERTYYPSTRKTLGASSFPNGREYYAELVRFHTTMNITPDEVFALGEREVARIRKTMDSVIHAVGFKGSFKEFLQFLRTDPRFFVGTPELLLKEASFIAKKVDGQLPSLFGKLPRLPYGVEAVPDYLAPTYTSGRASTGSVKNHRAGMYWVNTYNLKSRTLYTLEALTLHEAAPGHLLQTALSQELTNLPPFRQSLYINAFGEGWGLYSEYLGHELGLYKDPYSLFGRLTYEMWRACRLVIDVGIHWKGWTRVQAVSYLADNTALSLHEVNT